VTEGYQIAQQAEDSINQMADSSALIHNQIENINQKSPGINAFSQELAN